MRLDASEILGITPAIDPRRSEKIFALGGRNYVLDSLGPKSAFGQRFLSPFPLTGTEHIQGARLKLRGGDRVFTFIDRAILEWREDLGGWRTIFLVSDSTIQPYRWTYGYLNGVMYFCHPSSGILAYNIAADICLPLTAPGTPEYPMGILVNNGRLIVLDENLMSFSGPSDGSDFVPRLGGAGFQKINDRVGGDPICMTAWAKGVMVWTTGGVMRCEFTGDSAVYRFRAVNTELRPVNSFCAVQMDDNTMVILDERGLFQSSGETPEPMTPVFNEFLIQYLQKNNLKLGQNVRLEWDELKRYLYLSLSLSRYSPAYEKAFVLYPSLDKWGTLDESHHGILPVLIQTGNRQGDYYALCGTGGRIRYFLETGSRCSSQVLGTLEARYVVIQKPTQQVLGADQVIFSSSGNVNTIPAVNGRTGFYDSAIAEQPTKDYVIGLNSVLQFGLLRARDQVSHDRLMEVIGLFIGSNKSGDKNQLQEDYNLIPPGTSDEDYNAGTGGEDFGFETINYINHKLRIIGTMDGQSLFDETIPELERFDAAGRYFSCSVIGQWVIIEVSAIDVGEAYHVRVIELTAVDGGKLT